MFCLGIPWSYLGGKKLVGQLSNGVQAGSQGVIKRSRQ